MVQWLASSAMPFQEVIQWLNQQQEQPNVTILSGQIVNAATPGLFYGVIQLSRY